MMLGEMAVVASSMRYKKPFSSLLRLPLLM
jgi:hypothetical protein